MTDYEALLPFAETPAQRGLLEAILKHKGVRPAIRAKATTMTMRNAFYMLDRIKLQAARRGHAPDHDMTRTVPDGFHVKGVSTYYDKDGKPTGQWVKSNIDYERQKEAMVAACEAMSEGLPRLPPVKAPSTSTLKELCNLYTLTDCHVGMRAWSAETLGDNWDLDIAESVLTAAFDAMLVATPDSRVGVIAQLGDWMHWDGLDAVTPTNRHILDADGRFGKVVKASIRILRRVIDRALAKHQQVILLIAEGNHDLASSVWLRNMFAALYGDEKRLTVIDSELPFYVHQHGKTMLAWHHGHLKKNDALPLLMASQFPKIWGTTTKRYVHVGHRHSVDVKEHNGMTVVQHATIAARDAYAARHGWISERQIRAITYHVEYGEVASVVITPEMLK